MQNAFLKFLPWASAGFLILFPFLNLAGWFLGNSFLIQLRPGLAPLPPNAAVCFILLGSSLACHLRGRPRAGLFCALAVLAVALAVGMEYLTGWDPGIDRLLIRDYPAPMGAFPGRIPPNGSVCFLLSSLALALMSHPGLFRRAAYPVGLLGSIVSALGGMALLGYIFNVEAAYTWGERLAGMALLGAVAFWMLGFNILYLAWRLEKIVLGSSNPYFMPICFSVGTACASLVFWKALMVQENKHVKRSVASEMVIIKSELRGELRLRIQTLEAMSRRWESVGDSGRDQVRKEYEALLRHHRGYQAMAWADSSLVVRWAAPLGGNEAALDARISVDPDSLLAFETAFRSNRMRHSHSVPLLQGGLGYHAFQPINHQGRLDGVLVGVFRYRELFQDLMPASFQGEYSLYVSDDGKPIYHDSGYQSKEGADWALTDSVEVGGTTWTLDIRPKQELLRMQLSNLPNMVLAGGLLIALLMAASLHYGQSSLIRAAKLRQSNRELESSRESFANIVEKNADGLIVVDGDGLVRFANPMAAKLLGRPPGDLEGNPFPHPLAAGRTVELRLGVGQAFRSILEMSAVATDWEGRPAVLASLRDISERVRTREALRRSEAKLRRLVDSNIAGVFFADGDGLVREANEAFLRLTGYGHEELAEGRVSWRDLMAQASADAHGKVEEELEGHGVSGPHEDAYLRKDGRTVSVLVAAASVGPGQGTVAFVLDISDRKAAEEALIRNEEQLRQSQKMEAVGRLAGGVAHDFNNLLTAINGYSDLVLGLMAPGSRFRPHLEEIKKAGDKAASLTRQLLAFSRKQVVVPKILEVNGVVAEMVSLIRRLIGENIDLKVVSDPSRGRIKADPGLLQQVILNLAINSRDAMPHGGELRIETFAAELDGQDSGFHLRAAPGPYVALAVKDTGWGMDESVRSHLFEPFFSTKEKGKGTGLGLSTVYGIVKQFNGAINVETRTGHGSAFTLFFPRVEDEAKPEPSKDMVRQQSWGRGDESILLVEDEESVRKLAQRILTEKGYAVTTAGSGAEAMGYFKADPGKIRLLLTDVVMPGMSGRELAEKMLAESRSLRVVFMSGYTEDAAVQKGILTASTAFIGKPFSPDALLQAVREALDGA